MEQEGKGKYFFTIFIFIVFVIFSYALVKSFFEEQVEESIYTEGNFRFIYNTKEINKKLMYDDNRTVGVVMNKNYTNKTNDIKSKLFIKPLNIDYYYDNIKLSIKKSDYLDVYMLDKDIRLVILGSDLSYYKIRIGISENNELINMDKKGWQAAPKSIMSIYPNVYYKVINDKYNVFIELPGLLNEEKYPESEYKELKNKIISLIDVKEEPTTSNYYVINEDKIKLDNKTSLLLSDIKIDSYTSKKENNYSYTKLSYNNSISISEIDDIDNYLKEYDSYGSRSTVDYKGYSVQKLVNDNSLLFEIDNKYYKISTNKSIDNIDSFIEGILEIKE